MDGYVNIQGISTPAMYVTSGAFTPPPTIVDHILDESGADILDESGRSIDTEHP
jgi:hypothetical protein